MTKEDDQYLTVEEAAKKLGVARITAYRWIYNGELPAVKFGRTWRISAKQLAQKFENKP